MKINMISCAFFLFIGIIFSNITIAQPTIQWAVNYNGSLNATEKSYDVAIDDDGNVYVTGSSDLLTSSVDYVTIKYNTFGDTVWMRHYNGTGNLEDYPAAIGVDSSGNVYVTGKSKGSGTGYDYATIKYNSIGVQQWVKRFNNSSANLDDIATAIFVDDSGNVYVTGYSIDYEFGGSKEDYVTIKYNTSGVVQWTAGENVGAGNVDKAYAITVDNTANVYVTGESTYLYITYKYTPSGGYGGMGIYTGTTPTLTSTPTSIVVDNSGNIYITGRNDDDDIHTVKYPPSLINITWDVSYNGIGNGIDGGNDLKVDASGNVYVTGYTDVDTSAAVNNDYVTIKYNSSGAQQWATTYNGSGNGDDVATSFAIDNLSSPNLYVTGYSAKSSSAKDITTIKYNNSGAQQWAVDYDGGTNEDDFATALQKDIYNNIFLTGYSVNSSTNENFVTIKYCASMPTANAGNDTTICFGDSTELKASGGGTYSWWPTSNLTDTTISNPIANPTSTTTYYVTVSNNGCQDVDSITITVYPLPIANAGSDSTICSGDSTQLAATGGSNYLWSPSTGLSNISIFNPLAFPTTNTTYTVLVTDTNGCTDTDDVVITVNPVPTANAGSDSSICIGDSTQLSASGGGTYLWSPSTGLSDTTISNPIAFPSTSTTYTVAITNTFGCKDIDDIIVTVNSLPTANAGSDTTICSGDSIQLTATGGNTYLWSPSTGLSSTIIANPLAFPTSTTTYTVLVTNINGCKDTDDVAIAVNPLPTANAGSDVSICLGDSIQLSASGGGTYLWSPSTGLSNINISNPIAFPTSTTSYTVTITDTNGCKDMDDVLITIMPDAIAGNDTSICLGDSIQLTAIGGTSYSWSPGNSLNDSTIANPYANPTATTTYTVTVSDTCGTDVDAVIVTVNPLPIADAGLNTTITEGDTTMLNATGGVTYLWSPSTGLNSPSISDPLAFPDSTTTYTVTVIDSNGCSDIDSVTITVKPSGIIDNFNTNEFSLSVYPNPSNSEFQISYDLEQSSSVIIKIYNLFGSEIATIVDMRQQAGIHKVSYNGNNLTGGIYTCKMLVEGQTVGIKKIVIIK